MNLEKKKPEADINRKSGMFLNLGLVISLGLVIMAFEWRFYEEGDLVDLGTVDDNFEDIIDIPPTQQPPPPPPVIQQPEIIEVPDEEEIEEEIEIDLDIEVTEDEVIEEIVFEEAPEEEEVDEIFTIVEETAEPPGGMAAFYKYVAKNMNYPNQAKRMGIEGRVFVQFVVDKDGSITDVQAVKGIGAGCDEEAVRVVAGASKWKPGKQRGRPVKQRIILPITFKLN
jgi:protein TonB